MWTATEEASDEKGQQRDSDLDSSPLFLNLGFWAWLSEVFRGFSGSKPASGQKEVDSNGKSQKLRPKLECEIFSEEITQQRTSQRREKPGA